MQRYARSHLSDPSLLQSAVTNAGRERTATADLLADLAEIDARRLHLPAGYPSLYAYCAGELHLCEHAALKRIQAARAARRFPVIFSAVAEGRLHLSAVVLLAPHLTEHTAKELLSAATHKSKSEIERLLAERFPKSDVLAWVAPIPSASPGPSGTPGVGSEACQLAPGRVQNGTVPEAAGDRSSTKPLSSQSFAVQFTMSRSAHDNLRYAQALLGHQVPTGDIAQVIERALAVFVPYLEKVKFAATAKPRSGRQSSTAGTRHISAPVRRTVWVRDEGQCTFESESGQRCPARTRLEFDHIEEFARGGEATVSGIRLRCRAHNQYGAECTFGTEFMRHKRIAAAEARAAAKERANAARAQAAFAEQAHVMEVVHCLRQLGFSAREARDAADLCRDMPGASLEERVRVALSYFHVRGTRKVRPGESLEAAEPRASAGAVGATERCLSAAS